MQSGQAVLFAPSSDPVVDVRPDNRRCHSVGVRVEMSHLAVVAQEGDCRLYV